MNTLNKFIYCLWLIASRCELCRKLKHDGYSMKKLVYLLSLIFALFIGFSAFQSPKEYSIEQFLDTKRYAGACFSFDEKEILYSSDETGIFNIYKSSLDGKNVTQLTDSKEHAYMLMSSFPEDSGILFSSDMLGNERNHIFVRNS